MEQFLPEDIDALERFTEEYYHLYNVCDYGILFMEGNCAFLRKYFNSDLSCEQACEIVAKYDRGEEINYENVEFKRLVTSARRNQLPYEKTSVTLRPQQFVQEHKQQQIVKLAEIVTEACQIDAETKIIDMGGGVGHLAREI